MSSAAMQSTTNTAEVSSLPAAHFVRWRRSLAAFVMTEGLRASLEHVPMERWAERFMRGESPEEAALAEYEVIAD